METPKQPKIAREQDTTVQMHIRIHGDCGSTHRAVQVQADGGLSTESGKSTWAPTPNREATLILTGKENFVFSNGVSMSIEPALQGRPHTQLTNIQQIQ